MRKAVEMMLNYHENNVIIMRKRLLILAETWPGHIFKRLLKEKHLIFHIVTLNKNISLFLRAQNKHKNMFIKTAESIMIWAWPCVCVCARISEQSLSSLYVVHDGPISHTELFYRAVPKPCACGRSSGRSWGPAGADLSTDYTSASIVRRIAHHQTDTHTHTHDHH